MGQPGRSAPGKLLSLLLTRWARLLAFVAASVEFFTDSSSTHRLCRKAGFWADLCHPPTCGSSAVGRETRYLNFHEVLHDGSLSCWKPRAGVVQLLSQCRCLTL